MPIKNTGERPFHRAWIGAQGQVRQAISAIASSTTSAAAASDEGYPGLSRQDWNADLHRRASTGPHIQSALGQLQGFLDPFTFQIGAGPPCGQPRRRHQRGRSHLQRALLARRRSRAASAATTAAKASASSVTAPGGTASGFLTTATTVGKGALARRRRAARVRSSGRVAFFPFFDPTSNRLGVRPRRQLHRCVLAAAVDKLVQRDDDRHHLLRPPGTARRPFHLAQHRRDQRHLGLFGGRRSRGELGAAARAEAKTSWYGASRRIVGHAGDHQSEFLGLVS